MIKFPHIHLLRNVLAYVEHVNTDPEVPEQYRITKPVTFTGSIKLHGANCGVVWTPDGNLQAQSRETLLNLPSDDYKGFAAFVADHREQILGLIQHVRFQINGEVTKVALYGEWVGAGVVKRNKGSAVSKFEDKHWALFAATAFIGADPEAHNVSAALVDIPLEGRIGCVTQAGDWTFTVDFNDPESIKAGEAEAIRITESITAQCPYGKLYGLEGAGEGIVWMPTGEFHGREDLMWKCKSEAHQVINEGKLKKERPPVDADVQARVVAFVDAAVTTNRLEQGLDALEAAGHEVSKRSTGHYIKWVGADVERECALELTEAALTWDQVNGAVTTRAREFLFAQFKK